MAQTRIPKQATSQYEGQMQVSEFVRAISALSDQELRAILERLELLLAKNR